MSNDAPQPAPSGCPDDQHPTNSLEHYDLPDRWCFGLAHPYIQRLIFLAGTLEQTVDESDAVDCQPSQADR
jgi:hypothetical protein